MDPQYKPVRVAEAPPREESEKLIVFTAGTKGGVGKSSVMPLLYSWYRTVCNVNPVCIDFDPQVGSFEKCLDASGVETLPLKNLRPGFSKVASGDVQKKSALVSANPNKSVSEELPPSLQDLLVFVRDSQDSVFLVDLPASSKDFVDALLTDFDIDMFGMLGIRIVFLHLHCHVSDDTAVETSYNWLERLKDVPHVPLAVVNLRDGDFDYPDNRFAGQFGGVVTLPKFNPDIRFTIPSLVPFPYLVMPFMVESVRNRVLELVGRKGRDGTPLEDFSATGLNANGFVKKVFFQWIEKNWVDDRIRRFTEVQKAGTLLDRVFQDFAENWEVFSVPSMDAALLEFDKKAGFKERALDEAYKVVRMFPDPSKDMDSWDNLVPFRDVVISVFGEPAKAGAKDSGSGSSASSSDSKKGS